MAVTAAVILVAATASGLAGWMMWALSLNGFMGQQRAVETSMIVYIALAAVSAVVCLALGILAVYLLSHKRSWNAAGSAALSIVVFVATTGVLHTLAVVISAVVAEQMRTNR